VNAFIAAGDSLGTLVQLLQSTGRFRVTQSPVIFTSNNKKAIIASGSEIAVPTQTLSNVDNSGVVNNTASVSASVQFKQVVLQLEVVPLINSDKEVALDILQKLDSLSGQSTQVGGNNIPTINTRYIRTSVSVPNEATIALGGLIKQETRASNAGVPYLQNIPVLGYLFKSKTDDKQRSELVILMKPSVVNSPAEISDATQHEQEKMHIEPDLESTLDAAAEKAAIKAKVPQNEVAPKFKTTRKP
jgi:type II secretory pathway component GspD/PulD (secretin)